MHARLMRLGGTLLLALATPAAASQRTFVSADGSDASPCSLSAPCRSLSAALAQTDASGEIVVLNTAGYGPVTIGKSVQIVAPPGVHAGITAISGNGVTIDGAGIDVTLRGLTIGSQTGAAGIKVVRAAHVYVERCVVSHFVGDGIEVAFSGDAVGDIRVVDSTMRANGNGVKIALGRATIVDSRIEGNGASGIVVRSGRVSVQRASLSGNHTYGLLTQPSTDSAFATVSESVVAGNELQGVAISASGGTARLVAHANAISDTNPSCGTCNGISSYAAASASALLAASRNVVTRSGGRGMYQFVSVNAYTFGDNVLVDNVGGSKAGTFVTATYE